MSITYGLKAYSHLDPDTSSDTVFICVEVEDEVFDAIKKKAVSRADKLKIVRGDNVVLLLRRRNREES